MRSIDGKQAEGLLSTTAIYHVIANTRATAVVTEFLLGRRLEVWIAD